MSTRNLFARNEQHQRLTTFAHPMYVYRRALDGEIECDLICGPDVPPGWADSPAYVDDIALTTPAAPIPGPHAVEPPKAIEADIPAAAETMSAVIDDAPRFKNMNRTTLVKFAKEHFDVDLDESEEAGALREKVERAWALQNGAAY